jgi:hypothetical protein
VPGRRGGPGGGELSPVSYFVVLILIKCTGVAPSNSVIVATFERVDLTCVLLMTTLTATQGERAAGPRERQLRGRPRTAAAGRRCRRRGEGGRQAQWHRDGALSQVCRAGGDSTFCHFKIYVNNYTTQIHKLPLLSAARIWLRWDDPCSNLFATYRQRRLSDRWDVSPGGERPRSYLKDGARTAVGAFTVRLS